VVARADYLPFGDVRAGGSGAEKYTYTGKEQDKTGLYYFEARYNSSEFRHFTQADIAAPDYGDPQDLNRYAYVGNNPLSYVDEDGFKKKKKKKAKLSKREKWMIAHGTDPDHDKTTLKKAKKQFKAGEKYIAAPIRSAVQMTSNFNLNSKLAPDANITTTAGGSNEIRNGTGGWQWYEESGFSYRARKTKEYSNLSNLEKLQLFVKVIFENYANNPLAPGGDYVPFLTPSDPRYEIDRGSFVPESWRKNQTLM
jgi:RHS repeat-associated protein